MDIKMIIINYVPVLLILFFLGIYMPNLTRKEIFFGIRIPEDIIDTPEIIRFKRQYIKNYLLICGLLLLVIVGAVIYSKNEIVFVIGIFIYLFVEMMVYYNTHKKVKDFKSKHNWEEGKREVLVVDTSFRSNKNGKILVSSLWFLVPIAIIIANIIIGYKVYPDLPNKLPLHWNSQGIVDTWVQKSHKVIFMLPVTEVGMLVVMYISYKVIGMSKVQINASNPEVSREQNRRFRYLWSGYIVFLSVFITLIFTFAQLTVLTVIKCTSDQMVIAIVIPTIIIIVASIALSVITGQGGSRIKISQDNKNEGYIDRNDDKYWKMGMFYVNKNDPAMIIEKRFGIGWTINFGNTKAIILFILLMIFIILSSVMSVWMAK
ncbi:DUF1648 domain-containing protein [Clostridium sp. MB40-C1]|uniref:DUF1648 domain-containing protein n=1 Tax=Clostridium sp. MB40-C1 TaxID=3070996 RepID=UPI0027E175C5|nr:DUF5808 domain-containing protein [Clostridium sp. MB40-C1]WMJ79861.1 DUF1648 domain-containing protein [Clostridium sp. MB40-C1]